MAGGGTFTLSAEDVVAANRDWWRGMLFNRGAAARYAIPVVIGFLVGAGVTAAGGANPGHSLWWGLAAAVYMIVLLALSYWLLGRRSRRLSGSRSRCTSH